jgi:DNA-binding transcriptional LysR family regulator
MNIEQLKFVFETANKGTITAASESLHVSQSAISQAISKLEMEVGYKIFQRSRTGISLTAEGAKVMPVIHEILSRVDELKRIPNSQEQLKPFTLKITLCPGFISTIHKSLHLYKQEHPSMNIDISEKESRYIFEDIRQNRTDIGLISIPRNQYKIDHDLHFHKLFHSKMKAYVSRYSPLAARTSISPNQLIRQSIVLHNSRPVLAFAEHIKEKYKNLTVLLTTNKLEIVKKSVMEEGNLTLFAEEYARRDPEVISGDIVALSISGYTKDFLTYGWIYSKKSDLQETARDFVRFANALLT